MVDRSINQVLHNYVADNFHVKETNLFPEEVS